jgi:hypothetical protein
VRVGISAAPRGSGGANELTLSVSSGKSVSFCTTEPTHEATKIVPTSVALPTLDVEAAIASAMPRKAAILDTQASLLAFETWAVETERATAIVSSGRMVVSPAFLALSPITRACAVTDASHPFARASPAAFALQDEEELQRIYQWIDEIPLSRPKRNISRDFADGVLVAEVVSHYYPRMVELHNYPAANSFAQKLYNWQTLSKKVFKKIGLNLQKAELEALCNAEPGAIETLLKRLQVHVRAATARDTRVSIVGLPPHLPSAQA